MSDALYKKLYSYKNLDLAWSRIKTAQNIQYKNYYRSLFLSYELSKVENLHKLSERLKGKSFSPSRILRFYLPKSTGLHRPLSFLFLDDMILYQAMVNIIADKFSDKRLVVENENVYSNILNRDEDKNLFFFKKWQEGYSKFRNAIKTYFIGGAKWVAHFDIAAYYDTISHTTLSQQISKKTYQDFRELFEGCLKEWSSSKKEKIGHGIPQGPIASDLLGEIYLLPIDIVLNKHKIKYVRYVDDIKIFGKTRSDVLYGVLLLERECKERGLVPHAKKYEVLKAKSVDEAIGKYPSLSTKEKYYISQDKDQTAKLFLDAFTPSEFDISKVKYILKVSPPNRKIRETVIDNLNNHPELVEEFCTFLGNYKTKGKIAQSIYDAAIINCSHYEYVEGKYWELLSTFACNKSLKRRLINKAIRRLKDVRESPPLKYGLYRMLASTGNNLVVKWLDKEKSAFIQMLIVSHINHNGYSKSDFIAFVNRLLRRSNYEPGLVCLKQLIFSFKFEVIKELEKPSKDFSGVLHNTLGKPESIDSIGQILNKRYGISYSKKWKAFLGTDYEHANNLIFLADKSFFIDRNAWIGYTDSFCDLVIRQFINTVNSNISLPSGKSWPRTTGANGKNVDYGSLLDINNQFSVNYHDIANELRTFHDRRSKTPSTHAYEKKTGAKTTILTGKEQKKLIDNFRASFEKLIIEIKKLI
ncbi:MAG: RNA-directed DNA polymerase [Nitrospirae bacterium]|nr:RNA-directed DNA polymerase [Nitrospirota bacterium]